MSQAKMLLSGARLSTRQVQQLPFEQTTVTLPPACRDETSTRAEARKLKALIKESLHATGLKTVDRPAFCNAGDLRKSTITYRPVPLASIAHRHPGSGKKNISGLLAQCVLEWYRKREDFAKVGSGDPGAISRATEFNRRWTKILGVSSLPVPYK